MARRTQKSLESLARQLAHDEKGLSNFARRLFWTRLLWQDDPARALALLTSSLHPMDRDYVGCAATAGHRRARLTATVDLAIASIEEPNPMRPTRTPAQAPDIFVWHDWPSFEMDLDSWLTALPKAELVRELKRRVAAGLARATAREVAQRAACSDEKEWADTSA